VKDLSHWLKETEIKDLWNQLYNLSLQMLADPSSAEDSVQEIFLKLVSRADSFRGDSSFQTWAYALAKNYLIDRIRKDSREGIRFSDFKRDLHGFEPYRNELGLNPAEEALYIEQIKAGCTTAMLQCLKPRDRLVFVLGNLFGMAGERAASICEMSAAAYRKALSRSRQRIQAFMQENCGLMNPQAECQCRKRLKIALDRGRIGPAFSPSGRELKRFKDLHRQMSDMDRLAEIYGENPYYEDIEGLKDYPFS